MHSDKYTIHLPKDSTINEILASFSEYDKINNKKSKPKIESNKNKWVKISKRDEPKKEREINTKDIIGMNNYFDPLI